MLKQFQYVISVNIQNRINGQAITLNKTFIGEIEVNEITYFSEFRIADDHPISYVQDVISNYCSDEGINIEDIDIIKFSVTSDDPNIVVYFEQANAQEFLVGAPIYAYTRNPSYYLSTPGGFKGEAVDESSIIWKWNNVAGCAFKIVSILGEAIADIGIGITEYKEEGLLPNTNYTRAIKAYNAEEESLISEYETVSTLSGEVEEELTPFTVEFEEDVDLTLIENADRLNYIKSGIGQGDDLKVSISDLNEEAFSCVAKAIPGDITIEDNYKEQSFLYRQKTTGETDKACSFGNIKGEVYAFPPKSYDSTIFAEVDANKNIQRPTNIQLTVSAEGPAIINKPYSYKIKGEIANQEVNVQRPYKVNINAEYNRSFDFNYHLYGQFDFYYSIQPQKEVFIRITRYFLWHNVNGLGGTGNRSSRSKVINLTLSNLHIRGTPFVFNLGSILAAIKTEIESDSSIVVESYESYNIKLSDNPRVPENPSMEYDVSLLIDSRWWAAGWETGFTEYYGRHIIYGKLISGDKLEIYYGNDGHTYKSFKSETFSYTGLKSFSDPLVIKNDVNRLLVSIKEQMELETPKLSRAAWSIKDIKVNCTNTSVRAFVSNNKVYAENTAPDKYSNDFKFEGIISSKTGKVVIATTQDISNIPLYAVKKGSRVKSITLGSGYAEQTTFKITSIDNEYIDVAWDGIAENQTTGPLPLEASTSKVFDTYTGEFVFNESINTSLTEEIKEETFTPDYSKIQLICQKTYPGGTVNESDRAFKGLLDEVNYILTKLSGDPEVVWAVYTGEFVKGKQDLKVFVDMETRKYLSVYNLSKTLSSESGDNVLLFSEAEIATYRPYYNQQKWPEIFELSDITYKVACNQPYANVFFNAGDKQVKGPVAISVNITPYIAHYTALVVLQGHIYDYENNKPILKKQDIVLVDDVGDKYTGPMDAIKYTINNKNAFVIVSENGDTYLVAILSPTQQRKILDIDNWVALPITAIDLSGTDAKDNEAIGFVKTGGWTNTFAKNSGGNVINKEGMWIFDKTRKIYLYAEKQTVTVKDFAYGPHTIGIVNAFNYKDDLVIPIANLLQGAQNIEHSLEIEGVNLTYSIVGDSFVVSSINDIYKEFNKDIELDPVIGTTGLKTIISNTVERFDVVMDNPKLMAPGKNFVLSLESDNPNISLKTEFDINSVGDEAVITVPVTAEMVIASQTPWYPELTPGYYYLSSDEYYLFGGKEVEVIMVEENKYKTSPLPKAGSPIIVTGLNNTVFTQVLNGLEIEEEIEVINSRYLKLSNTGIDVDTLLLNGQSDSGISVVNNIVILSSDTFDDTIIVRYKLTNSYFVEEKEDHLIITVHGNGPHSISYETGSANVAKHIDINPLRNPISVGFLYIKD